MIDYRLPTMPRKIDEDSMRVFLHEMREKGLLYHVDDDPRDIGFYDYKGDWVPTFSDSESYALIGFFSMATNPQDKDRLSWSDIWDCMPDLTF